MRWPWQRKEVDPEAPPAAAPRDAAGPVPSPAGWAFLPPLQRTVGELGTTTAPHRFPDRLPTRSDPSFTGTMSHLISAEAPAGVIDLDGPDAGPAPAPPGSAGRSVEMPLLPPPAPLAAGGGRPVQRLAPAVQRSLTSVPEGDFGVLQVPAVPGTGDGTTGPPAEQPVLRPRGKPGELPGEQPVERPAAPPGAQEHAGPVPPPTHGSATEDDAEDGGGPDEPGPVIPPPSLPLQRRVPDRSGTDSGDSGSSFDGTATIVPLPPRGTPLQRTAGPASAAPGAASSPSGPSGPVSPPRLGLGRPWPARDPVPDPAGAEQSPSPALQRVHGSDGRPPAVIAAPVDTETSSVPESTADGPAALPGTGTTLPADAPAVLTPAADDGPVRSSPGTPRAAVRAEPVVSRTPVDQPPAQLPAENPQGERTVPGGMPPASLSRGWTGGGPAPFADPPLFAGRQNPDVRRPALLPVVSRAADSVVTVRPDRTAPDDGGAPVVPTVPDQPSAGRGGGVLPSAPALPASGARSPGRSAAPGHPGNGGLEAPVDLPVVSRSTTSSPAEEPVPGAWTATGDRVTPQVRSGAGPAAADVQRAVQGAVDAPLPGSGAAVPETAPFSSAARSSSDAGHPARSLGLRPSLFQPVVSRSAGEGQALGSARTTVEGMHPTAPSAAPATRPAPDGSVRAPVSPAVPAAGAAEPGTRSAGRASDGGEQVGEPPVLSAVARAAGLPGGGSGSPPDRSELRQAPIGTLQRSFADPEGSPRRPRLRGTPLHPRSAPGVVARTDAPLPAPRTPHGATAGPPDAAGEPVAMLLAIPDRGSPGAGSAASSSVGPTARPTVQRLEVQDGTDSSPAPVCSGGTEPVQRVGEEVVPGTGPAATPGEPSAAPAAPGEEGMSQEQVEQLAKRLVGPIVRRIKADMLLDRERRGLRIDVS